MGNSLASLSISNSQSNGCDISTESAQIHAPLSVNGRTPANSNAAAGLKRRQSQESVNTQMETVSLRLSNKKTRLFAVPPTPESYLDIGDDGDDDPTLLCDDEQDRQIHSANVRETPSVTFLDAFMIQDDWLPSARSIYELNPKYAKVQLRQQLIDQMAKYCFRLKFQKETLYVACTYMDRYLSRVRVVQQKQYALLAMTCTYLAGKIEEEIYDPTCSQMIACYNSVTSDVDGEYKFTATDLRRMERKLVVVIKYNVLMSTPSQMLDSMCKQLLHEEQTYIQERMIYLAQDVIYHSIYYLDILCARPQIICAASLLVAMNKSILRYRRDLDSTSLQLSIQCACESREILNIYDLMTSSVISN
ncbi:hypothetical protein MIR68_003448 [Amoeboaphelidium protococcarum]|nr:hypothetical protein MIR68_003448 [Amoeboaphelidium protococcarum]